MNVKQNVAGEHKSQVAGGTAFVLHFGSLAQSYVIKYFRRDFSSLTLGPVMDIFLLIGT